MCAGRAGAVPGKNGFRESSGRVPGKFRWVPRFGSEVPGFRGSKVPRFREPVPMGAEVWIDSRVPRFQEPVPMVPGTCYDGFRGLDRFQITDVLANYFEGHVTFQNNFFKIIFFNRNYFDNSLA